MSELDKDNRNLEEFTEYQQCRVDALKTRVAEVEAALRFMLGIGDNDPLPDLSGYIAIPERRKAPRDKREAV